MVVFDYNQETLSHGHMDLEDVGHCAIEAKDDKNNFYYLVIKTSLGKAQVFEYGPATPDFDKLPFSVSCTFNRIDFNEGKLNGIIDRFLNNSKRGIVEAKEVDLDEALDNCKDIINYVRVFDEGE